VEKNLLPSGRIKFFAVIYAAENIMILKKGEMMVFVNPDWEKEEGIICPKCNHFHPSNMVGLDVLYNCSKCDASLFKEEEPKELTPDTVIKWSKTYKQLEILEENGQFKTYSIRAKARKFVKAGCIDYVKKADTIDGRGYYRCKPIEGYNKTTYKIYSLPNQQFECDCQFYQRVVKTQKIPGLICSHILALKLQLKIWNWERKKAKELDGFK